VSTVKLTNAARTSVALGVLTRSGEDEKGPLVATVSAPLAPGGYTVSWRSASADGHAMSGTIEFVVKER
jgi:methionine-rich copper-binding protein CopC